MCNFIYALFSFILENVKLDKRLAKKLVVEGEKNMSLYESIKDNLKDQSYGEVYTVCYNTVDIWKSKKAAMDFYEEAIYACEGSERDRYVNVYMDLKDGKTFAYDGDGNTVREIHIRDDKGDIVERVKVDGLKNAAEAIFDYKNGDKLKESEDGGYEEIDSKYVEDSSGFTTQYTMYKAPNGKYVFVFGDKDLYRPEDEDFDWEADSEEEAREWFNSYNGFSDMDEAEKSREEELGGTYYVYVMDKDKEIPAGIEITGKSIYPRSKKCIFHTRKNFTPEEMQQYGLEYLSADLMRREPILWKEINYAADHPDYLGEAEIHTMENDPLWKAAVEKVQKEYGINDEYESKRDFLYAMYDKIKEAWEAIDWHSEMYYEPDMYPTDLELIIIVNWGDWKHDHIAIDRIAEQATQPISISSEVTEEDGSDTYSADHYYKYSEAQYKKWLRENPMKEAEEPDTRKRKIVKLSNQLKSACDEIANIAGMYDEFAGDKDDTFYGTEDEYALEMLDQHLGELFLNDPILSNLDDGQMTEVIGDIMNRIVDGYNVDFRDFLGILKKYKALDGVLNKMEV